MNPAAAPRLLVIDDEPDLRTLYELSLLREGYDVDTAGSVAEALASLGARGYQLVYFEDFSGELQSCFIG